MGLPLSLVFVGRLKEKFFIRAYEHYRERLGRYYKLEEIIIRDAPAKLPPVEKSKKEGDEILKRLTRTHIPICLDEKGKSVTSRQLADRLRFLVEQPGRNPAFIIGGPFGLSGEVKAACESSIRLGRITLPHELARITLMEQLYRAASILRGSSYHHD